MSALSNARQALVEVRLSISDRRSLQDGATFLDEKTCLSLLAMSQVGRLAYIARAGVPDIVPVNYVLSGRSLLIRSGSGPKQQAAQRRARVAFEVDALDPDDQTAWSVVVHGRLSVVPVSEHLDAPLPEPWSKGPRRHLIRLTPSRITGRALPASED